MSNRHLQITKRSSKHIEDNIQKLQNIIMSIHHDQKVLVEDTVKLRNRLENLDSTLQNISLESKSRFNSIEPRIGNDITILPSIAIAPNNTISSSSSSSSSSSYFHEKEVMQENVSNPITKNVLINDQYTTFSIPSSSYSNSVNVPNLSNTIPLGVSLNSNKDDSLVEAVNQLHTKKSQHRSNYLRNILSESIK